MLILVKRNLKLNITLLVKTFKFSCEKSTQPEQIRIIGQPNYTPRKESVLEAYVNAEPKWNTTLLSKYLGIHYMQIASKYMDFFPTLLKLIYYEKDTVFEEILLLALTILKVRQSRKQIMVSSIFPKNEQPTKFLLNST